MSMNSYLSIEETGRKVCVCLRQCSDPGYFKTQSADVLSWHTFCADTPSVKGMIVKQWAGQGSLSNDRYVEGRCSDRLLGLSYRNFISCIRSEELSR